MRTFKFCTTILKCSHLTKTTPLSLEDPFYITPDYALEGKIHTRSFERNNGGNKLTNHKMFQINYE